MGRFLILLASLLLVHVNALKTPLVWYACRQSDIPKIDGSVISTPNFVPTDEPCVKAVVPGTVLQTLWANGTFKGDPFYEDNLRLIPDISKTNNSFYTFWFRTEFPGTPEHFLSHRLLRRPATFIDPADLNYYQLHFLGINYRAEVYFNGNLLGETVGMFQGFSFDISPLFHPGETNVLAVLVKPPDFPGVPNGQQGGDHEIAKNAAVMQCSPGIWDSVFITQTGSVAIEYPVVRTNNVSFDGDIATANLSIECYLRNLATTPTKGILTVTLGELSLSLPFSLPASNSIPIHFPPTFLHNANLWWPHTYGDPYLYPCQMSAATADGKISDHVEIQVGIREVRAEIDPIMKGWVFYVNKERVYLQGGNWITTDQFLRFSTNDTRYYNEVRMHREMGLNLIRVWGGGLTERLGFYEACDALGVVVLQEFWMTGDNNGRWNGNNTWPLDHGVYLQNARDVVLRIRRHASLLILCGGNELDPEGKSPPPDIDEGLRKIISEVDPGRFYVSSSTSSTQNYNPYYGLSPQDGPHRILAPKDFFNRNPGLGNNVPVSFQPEIGRMSTPVVKSMRQFMSEKTLADFPKKNADFGQVNPLWTYHIYQPFTYDGIDYIYNFGNPENIVEYCFRAQIVLYHQFRSMYEGFQEHMWEFYSGMLTWKSQSPWPTLRGALYDSYLEQTGGFWGVFIATRHIHVQWNLLTDTLSLVNKLRHVVSTLTVRARTFDFKGNLYSTQSFNIPEISKNSIIHLPKINWPVNVTDPSVVLFFRFEVFQNGDSVAVDTNDYWQSNPAMQQNYTYLATLRMPQNLITLSVQATAKINQNTINGTITLRNSNSIIAFFVRIGLEKEKAPVGVENRILPVWYSANYVSLLPGEEHVINIECEDHNQKLFVVVDGWNVKEDEVPLMIE